MSDLLQEQLSKRLDEMSRRIDALERPAQSRWYVPKGPSDLIFLIGFPAALLAAVYAFYDGFYLKLQKLDAATVAVAQDKLGELQELRSEIFVLQARGEDAEIAAIVEAKASRRDRLVQESYRYWQAQPGYFTRRETILLAEELQLGGKQPEALEVIDGVKAATPIEKADLARFRASLMGAESEATDLPAARAEFKNALKFSEELDSETGRQQMWAKITYGWLFMELSQNTGCEHSQPVAEILGDLLDNDPDGYNLGVLDEQARMMMATNEARCS